jgi:signal transduction histidine kinase
VAATAWVITLRRRVNVQTEIIRQKVQRETILEERTRISREFHDTLEQALVGIGMQLDAATNMLSVASVPSEPLQILGMARSMIRHSHDEARRSVWNLRTHALEQGDLPTALSEMKRHVKNGSPVQIGLEISGNPRPLPSRIESHLLRIGQEATTNAVKHAQATIIRLELRYQPQSVQLSIQDDGLGFDAEKATSSEAGHFGLLGMRERAEKIGGTITVLSTPGFGTRINVTVPLSTATIQNHSSAYPNG